VPKVADEHYEEIEGQGSKGVGLFAKHSFTTGSRIYQLDYWSGERMPIHVTNHSCDPNASFDEHGVLRSARPIEEREEITYDYLRHPIPASPWNFECECGAARCRGWIDARGSASLAPGRNAVALALAHATGRAHLRTADKSK
jgi:SET domain-containing protein